MARRQRTVDPALWRKSEFMKASPVAREVWLGLISYCADDEGRLDADVWSLTQKLFPRSHPATEESVSEALRYWHDLGWLLLYGSDDGEVSSARYGFLTGWFEHQYIQYPEPSSIPAPPVEIQSWADISSIKQWYLQERRKAPNVHHTTVLAEFKAACESDCKLTMQKVRKKYALSAYKVHLKTESESKTKRESNKNGNGNAATGVKLCRNMENPETAAAGADWLNTWTSETATALERPDEAKQLLAWCKRHGAPAEILETALGLTKDACAVREVLKPIAYLQSTAAALLESRAAKERQSREVLETRQQEARTQFLSLYRDDMLFNGNVKSCEAIVAQTWGIETAQAVVAALREECVLNE